MTTDHENHTAPLNRLAIWSGNVRKTGAEKDIEQLMASIAAVGLISPLTIMRQGKGYAVVAGQRRLIALQRLADGKQIAKDHPVPCRIVDAAAALEISIAENAVRTDMHPADQFEAWRTLADNGMVPTDIAARFGVSERTVEKRLKLGRVAQAILDLYREEKLDLEQVMAFTVTDDQAEQVRVWTALSAGPKWQQSAREIREALTQGEIPSTDKRVRFIGLDAYEAAGGAVRRDLFSDKAAGWVSDPALLDRLVAEKVEAELKRLRGEGWKWVEFRPSFDWQDRRGFHPERGKTAPLPADEQAAFEALEAELAALEELAEENGLTDEQEARSEELQEQIARIENRPEVFSKEVMKRAGVIVTLEHDGCIEISPGLTRKEDMVKGKQADGASDEADDDSSPAAKSPFSAALTVELTKEFTGALQAELAANPHLALVALVHAAVASDRSPAHISFSTTRLVNDSTAEAALEKLEAKATKGMPDSYDDVLWGWLVAQKTDKLLQILAVHVARTVDATRHADDLRASLGLNLRKWFTPSAENYFGKVSKDQIGKDLAEMGVDASAINRLTALKKPVLAAEAAAQAEKSPDWLPFPLRPAV